MLTIDRRNRGVLAMHIQSDKSRLRFNCAFVLQARSLASSRTEIRALFGAAVPHTDSSRPGFPAGSQLS